MLAAMLNSRQEISEVKGKDLLRGRDCYLACLPTTSGTGSEVSPNAIFYDDADGSKQGIISPFLVPDASYIDPEMTVGLPPKETAATGMDALTHCIEAYANRNAHPVVDGIALQGIRRIGSGLIPAFWNGDDLVARTEMSIGSMCGGMCLGPVNTAAVHALAYPLGSIHGLAHGLANALLLPHVLRFNLDAAIGRYRDIALALGAEAGVNARTTALEGIRIIEKMVRACSLPDRLSGVGIGEPDIGEMVNSAMQVQRLLVNNPKELTAEDARKIYTTAL
jgi:alcohol dehydrogenase class IV